MQGPTIIHNNTPYNANLDIFLSLSPFFRSLYYTNSFIPMNITDGLSEHAFQDLVTSINNGSCISFIKSNNFQEIFAFLESSLVYHVHHFIEEICHFIVNNDKENIFTILNLIGQYHEISNYLNQYIFTNLKTLFRNPKFLTVENYILQSLFEDVSRKSDFSKDLEFITFIVNYVKSKGKECCLLFQFVDFNALYEIDSGNTLEELIQNNLIDFDFLGEKIVDDLKKQSASLKNEKAQNNINSNPNLINKQIESLEAKISKTEKECKIELNKIEEKKNMQILLQDESEKIDISINSSSKQSANAASKIDLLQKEKAELEQKLALLIQQEEEIKNASYEEEPEPEPEPEEKSETNKISQANSENNISSNSENSIKQSASNLESNNNNNSVQNDNSQQQSSGNESSMPLWCPKAKLTPPDQPFNEDTFLTNIQKVDKQMKIYPTEALKECFLIFNIEINDDDESDFSSKLNLINPNDRATLLDFLIRSSIEFSQPEISASLASLLAATDNSCDDYASSLFLEAADKNVPEAILNIGVMARLGRGVAQDDKMAAHMIIKAANIGLSEAISIVKLAIS